MAKTNQPLKFTATIELSAEEIVNLVCPAESSGPTARDAAMQAVNAELQLIEDGKADLGGLFQILLGARKSVRV